MVSRSSVVRGGRRLFMYTLRAACGDFCLQSVGCILPKEEEEEALITRHESRTDGRRPRAE